jgi:hypothetical protein
MFTPGAIKHYISLLILALLSVLIILGTDRINPSLINPGSSVLLAAGFAISAFISLLVFFKGAGTDSEKSVFMTLIALGIKMLLSFILALLFLAVFKNNQTGSVILFFILYLAFTVFVILTILSVLKKSQFKKN